TLTCGTRQGIRRAAAGNDRRGQRASQGGEDDQEPGRAAFFKHRCATASAVIPREAGEKPRLPAPLRRVPTPRPRPKAGWCSCTLYNGQAGWVNAPGVIQTLLA